LAAEGSTIYGTVQRLPGSQCRCIF
jgi:hypothetical protein